MEGLTACPLCGGELRANPRSFMAHWDCERGCRASNPDAWIIARTMQVAAAEDAAPTLSVVRSA